ncbi:MAG: fibronectin type III-like domain-contianing protein [Thermomicrobiales bacterium]
MPRLAWRWPRKHRTAFLNYPGENGRVHYGERLFVGYRWYDTRQIAPLFPFGFGLSYTTFSYGEVQLNTDQIAPGEHLTADIEITNTGNVAGKEVVQLYIHDQRSRLSRPGKELKGFQKVELAQGETKRDSFTIERSALAYWDDRDHLWIAEAGTFDVLVGRSAGHIESRATFTLSKSETFIHS